MEKFVAVFAVLVALLAANVSVSEAQTVDTYFKAGGDLQLSPVPVSEKIFSIVWKYDKNLLAEWVKESINLTYYSKFKVRSKLDIVTGVLTVRNMTSGDKGVYSVEINNQVQSQVYQTVEIQEVPEPTVELQPLVCNSTSGSCRLICHGDVANAGPVSYFWKKDDGGWEPERTDRKELSIEERNNVKTFTCRMKNPVSVKDSKPYTNPLYREKTAAESSSVGSIVGGIIGGLVVLVLAGFGYWKKDQIKQKLRCLSSGPKSDSAPKTEDNKLLGVNSESNNTGKSSSSPSADKADNAQLFASNSTDTSDGKGDGAPTS